MKTTVEEIMKMINTQDREVAEKIHTQCAEEVLKFESLVVTKSVIGYLSTFSESHKERVGLSNVYHSLNARIKKIRNSRNAK